MIELDPSRDLVRKMSWKAGSRPESLLDHEWLVTNGLGGYASGTICGAATRRYHGLLIAALPVPLGRWMMLNHLSEMIRLPDGTVALFGSEEHVGGVLELYGGTYLQAFFLEAGLPVWHYAIGDVLIEKRIFMPHLQNTTYIFYRILKGSGRIRLKLRPSVHFRSHDAPVSDLPADPYVLTAVSGRYEFAAVGLPSPPLRLHLWGERAAFTVDEKKIPDIIYRVEQSRGYAARGDLWSPGYFRVDLSHEHSATLVVSVEPWEKSTALTPSDALAAEQERRCRLLLAVAPELRTGLGAELVLAADQFIINPMGRIEDAARARAAGDEVCTIIAGYPWFTDWGRDSMISLEGLTLTTGRHVEANYILRTFASAMRDGLIPNLFPEGGKEGLYHTADATLWLFHALERYLSVTDDEETLRFLLPRLESSIHHHLQGTRFGIRVDPADGLLIQGQEGYQLTWMDAKVGDWVVTPRRGKAVEINALWYNALRLMEEWMRRVKDAAAARPLAEHAERARQSFNQRFWYGQGGYLYDVIDGEGGDDPACRPNQILAIALKYPVLDRSHWKAVLQVVENKLLTPVGLRSLSPDHPDYKSKYYGDLRSRDAAYHQGTVWPWLIGPFLDAWLKIYPEERTQARRFLAGFQTHLSEACLGSISEIFDAESPFVPRGCVAQAWSIAEVLRAWAKTAE